MKKILFVFGTRPEAIKLAPLIEEMRAHSQLRPLVCVFRQHGKMLDQVLATFNIRPDYDLDVRLNDKDLLGAQTNILLKGFNLARTSISLYRFLRILKKEKPDLVIVHGDTSTAFLIAFLATQFKTPVAHVEAGLRTYNKHQPFPEEINRRLIDVLADIHFAPTEQAREFLLSERTPEARIVVTGNTAIDALLSIAKKQAHSPEQERLRILLKERYGFSLEEKKKLILVTAHRRESFGEGLRDICSALKEIAEKRGDVQVVYPVHLNPQVQKAAKEILGGNSRVHLIEPVEYELFVFLMTRAYLILTDSGGVQEEAPALGKPILVLRDVTERPEGIKAGAAKLVGTKKDAIVRETLALLDNKDAYAHMAQVRTPYGDGNASKRIVEAILKFGRNDSLR